MPKKILIDTDPGVDDAMAILLAFNSPELEIVGFTTVFGNATAAQGTTNALFLTEFAGHPDIPVAQGADKPLYIDLHSIADFVHGKDGFGNTNQPAPKGKAVDQHAAQFIIDMVMANPGEITLVPIGPFTNIALALAIEPRIVENVAEVVIMGGAALVDGLANPAGEPNVWHDPHSADLMLNAGWPVVMVGLDVTTKTLMTEEYLAELRDSRCLPGGRFGMVARHVSGTNFSGHLTC